MEEKGEARRQAGRPGERERERERGGAGELRRAWRKHGPQFLRMTDRQPGVGDGIAEKVAGLLKQLQF